MLRLVAVLGLAACVEGTEGLCPPSDPARVEMVPSDAGFGGFEDGDPIGVGTPPQGGAPYSPLLARFVGLSQPREGVELTVRGVDVDAEVALGEVDTWLRPICANVGASAGMWVTAEIHVRYFGWDLEELPGRDVLLTLTASDVDGGELSTTLAGTLDFL